MSERARPEFPYLDGLRGTAAMLVVLYHAFLFTGHTGDGRESMPVWGEIIGIGYIGVPIFIVLSGYVLMLPVATTPDLKYRGGTWRFVKRRARRILPPYYAALLFALALIAIFPVMRSPADTAWDSKLPVSWESVAAHLFMVQDMSPSWFFKINGPLWSVAVEWQIYFLMALLLLPLWRRVPAMPIVGALTLLTFVPVVVGVGAFLHPWFVALFAAGMWAAQLTVREREPRGVGALAIALGVAAVGAMVVSKPLGLPHEALIEMTVGLALAATLLWVGRREIAGSPSALVAPFRARPMMFLGLISYSVYLFHSPLLGLFNLLTLPLGLETVPQYLLMTVVGVPVAVTIAYGMFWLVERHFLNTRQRHAKQELETPDTPIAPAQAMTEETVEPA